MTRARAYKCSLAGVLAGMLLFSGCQAGGFVKPDGSTSTAVSIRLDSLPADLARDDTADIRATVLDENGNAVSVSTINWSTSDPKVATVEPVSSAGAQLTGKDQGTATITASYDQLSASKTLDVHRRPTDLVYVSGSGQTGTAGTQLPDSLVVRAVDRRGDVVSDVDISFVVTSGGGSVSPAGGLTDANGTLKTAWTLGDGTTQQVSARASEAQQRVQQLKDSVVVFTATTGPVVVGLAILPDSPTVNLGDSLQFDAVATISDGTQVNDDQVAWESTDTTVATISSIGLLHGRKAGQAGVIARTTQTATGNTVADTTRVTVASPASTSGTLVISSPDTLYGLGSTQTLTVQARAADGSLITNPDVQWSSLNPQVATVDRVGKVTARALGTALITAASLCCSPDTAGVVVAAPAVGTLTITAPDTLRGIGDTLTLSVDARAADGTVITNPDVQWSSLNPQVATVDSVGKVTARALGTALITAASLCCSPDTAGVVVAAPAVGTLTITAPDTLRGIGDTLTLSVDARAADGTVISNPDVTWMSLNPQVATVDSAGKVTARALGTALITAASLCCSPDTTGLVVAADTVSALGTITISPANDTLSGIGDTLTLFATARDPAGNVIGNPGIQWTSLDPSIATVDSMGTITARAIGTVLITAAAACCAPDSASMTVAQVETVSTDFSTTENPLSEGGRWINGRDAGLDWNNVQTDSGRAFAADFTGQPSRYSDAVAQLTADFAPNQYAQATVYRTPGYSPSVPHEIELLLRFQISAHSARGYEVLWGHDGNMAIVRWNGPVGDYTPLVDNLQVGAAVSGNVLRAEIVDGVIRVYRNGKLVATSPRDTTWQDGHPGIGFWPLPGATLAAYGWQSFSAGTLP